jgi:hypothetical protein
MKKTVLLFLSLTLAVSLVLLNFSPVRAFDWQAPVVTPISGDKEFTTVVTAPAALPGTVAGENGILFPAGFPAGTAQFGGDGVVVKGFTGGTASACFSMPPAKSEWMGNIHQWNGTKWVKLPTTVTQGDMESNSANACTNITSDGTYALIMGYTGEPEPKGLPVCSADLEIIGWGYSSNHNNPFGKVAQSIFFIRLSAILPEGTPVSYSIFNFSPPDALQGALNRSSTSSARTPLVGSTVDFPNSPDAWKTFPLTEYIISDQAFGTIPFTFRITLPDCYKDFPNPFHFK